VEPPRTLDNADQLPHLTLIPMIARTDLKNMARARLKDAEVLYQSGRYDSAAYLCGYAVELALKARICRTLKWAGFPDSNKDFEHYRSFKTHDLDVLLDLSGKQNTINSAYQSSWTAVTIWNPENRYKRIGSVDKEIAMAMIDSAHVILGVLL
jgi:hypothetical protein